MPACGQHIAKVRTNLEFVDFLLKASVGYFDWVTTAYFYASVHLVEAYFDFSANQHYGKHYIRRRAINLDRKIAHIFGSYRQLETYSRVARYGVKTFDATYIQKRVIPKFEMLRAEIGKLDSSLRI